MKQIRAGLPLGRLLLEGTEVNMTPGDTSVLESVLEQQKRILTALREVGAPKRRDMWDKLSAFSTFFSSVLLASAGFYFTNIYSAHQHERERVEETVRHEQEQIRQERRQVTAYLLDKVMPMVLSDDPRKRRAGLQMLSIGAPEMALLMAGPLAVDQLQKVAPSQTKRSK